MLYYWAKQIESGRPPRWEANQIITANTFQRFVEERRVGNILHDADLRKIMVDEARKLNYISFKVKQLGFVIENYSIGTNGVLK